jgi:hypothetical protein
VLLWNVISEKSGRICRIILFRIVFPHRVGRRDYDDTLEAIVMKEHDKDKNILTYSIFSIDLKENMLKEIVNLAGYEVTTL